MKFLILSLLICTVVGAQAQLTIAVPYCPQSYDGSMWELIKVRADITHSGTAPGMYYLFAADKAQEIKASSSVMVID